LPPQAPEVDRLVSAWGELREELLRGPKTVWVESHLERAGHLIGYRLDDARGTRLGVLSRAAWGSLGDLADHEGEALEGEARRGWARARLVERIDEEVAGLEAHRETLDLEAIEQVRAEAGDVALFDPSREAMLARRYEAESRRGFFQALKEFRRVEAEAAERPEPPAPPAPKPAALASSWEETLPPRASRPPLPETPPTSPRPTSLAAVEGVRRSNGALINVGRPPIGPG
jgi:hypothetical protein